MMEALSVFALFGGTFAFIAIGLHFGTKYIDQILDLHGPKRNVRMTMDYLQEIIASLQEKPAAAYDGLTLSTDHYKRMVRQFQENEPIASGRIPETFMGITVKEHPSVPEGFAVMTVGGEPVGVIDFEKRTATVIKPVTTTSGQAP